MLELLTTDLFARWFDALDDREAEDVATLLEVVEKLGPGRAAPDSRESLLWYEHESVSRFDGSRPIAFDLESWAGFREYAHRVLDELESNRFVARLQRLPAREANAVLEAVRAIKRRIDPRIRWASSLHASPPFAGRVSGARAELERMVLAVMEAAGLTLSDFPAHSRALREIAQRTPEPGFRILYGVHAERGKALFVLGEHLDRSFYGDSVIKAEALWRRYLDDELTVTPAPHR